MEEDTGIPVIRGVLETSLYVEDLDRSAEFYQTLFGFQRMVSDDRLCALGVGSQQVILLFRRGASTRPGITPGGTIPPHDGKGNLHMAFAIEAEDIGRWERRLAERSVHVESSVRWPRGGRSIYFRDPDNNSIELATPGTWEIY